MYGSAAFGTQPFGSQPADGGLDNAGTGAATLPVPVVAASGSVSASGTVSGSAAVALPLPTVSASGTSVTFTSGTGSVTLPLPVVAGIGTGTVGVSGSAAVSLPLPTVSSVAVTFDDVETDPPTVLDPIVAGSYYFRTRTRLVQTDSAEQVDVVAGSYTVDAGAIPMRRLNADIYHETLDDSGLLDVAATQVRVTAVSTTLDEASESSTPQVPLWLQSIRKHVDGRGTSYSIEAVDILGRLSANGLEEPVQSASTCVSTIRRLLNNAGHHHGVLVQVDGDVTDQAAPDNAVYDGDPVYAAQELVEQLDAMLVSVGANAVRIRRAPTVDTGSAYTASTVTAFTTVQERSPTRAVVETTSTDGSTDVTGTAGGSGSGDYGTVTARFYRPSGSQAEANRAARSLLSRVKGRRYRLEQVEMIPNSAIAFGQTWKVSHSGAQHGVVWAYTLPLTPTQPLVLRMRTPEDVT